MIKMALGAKATLGGIEEVQLAYVWPLLKNALLYNGDDGAGPAISTIKSKKLATSIEVLKDQVAELATTATLRSSSYEKRVRPFLSDQAQIKYLIDGFVTSI